MTAFDPAQPATTGIKVGAALDATRNNLVNHEGRIVALETIGPATTAEVTAARGSAVDLATRLAVSLDAAGNAPELVTARGAAASLAARLAVSLDANGNLNASTLSTLTWILSPDTPVYVSPTVFTVSGDRTLTYINGLTIKAMLGTSPVYNFTAGAVYSGVSGLTTVTLQTSCLTSNLNAISFGVSKGQPGSTWYNGTSAPSSGTGIDGDYYLNTITGDVYNKLGGSWGGGIGNIRGFSYAVTAGGSADAITATISGVSLVDNLVIAVRSIAANATPTPTLNLNGGGVKTITARGGFALRTGDIGPAGFVGLYAYRLASTAWELLNPASGGGVFWGGVAGGTANALTITTNGGLTAVKQNDQIAFRTGNNPNAAGTITLAVDSIVVKTLQKNGSSTFLQGDLPANTTQSAIFDGTYWQLSGGASGSQAQLHALMFTF